MVVCQIYIHTITILTKNYRIKDMKEIKFKLPSNADSVTVKVEMTRQELDHARYLNHREERLKKQREYYRTHREYYIEYEIKYQKNKSLVERKRIYET